MKFEDLAKHIEQNMPGVRIGKNLFISNVPASAKEGILLKESYAGTKCDPYMPKLRSGNFQVVVRGRDYTIARNQIERVSYLLEMEDVDFEEIHVKIIKALTEPIPYMESEGAFFEFAVNFYAVYDIVGE